MRPDFRCVDLPPRRYSLRVLECPRKKLYKELKKISNIYNVRQTGLLIAFDFKTTEERNIFCDTLFLNKMICNPTGTHSVRMRPNLAVTSAEIHTSLQIINSSLN